MSWSCNLACGAGSARRCSWLAARRYVPHAPFHLRLSALALTASTSLAALPLPVLSIRYVQISLRDFRPFIQSLKCVLLRNAPEPSYSCAIPNKWSSCMGPCRRMMLSSARDGGKWGPNFTAAAMRCFQTASAVGPAAAAGSKSERAAEI